MRKRIDAELNNLEQQAENLKQTIFKAKLEQPMLKKAFYWKPLALITAIIICIVSIYLLLPHLKSKNEPSQADTPSEEMAIQTMEETVPNPLTVAIYAHKLFFEDQSLYTSKEAKYEALNQVAHWYGFIYQMEEQGVIWSEERRAHYRERMFYDLKNLLQDEQFAAYYEMLKNDLQITDEEYVEHFLLVQYEHYDLLSRVDNDKIHYDSESQVEKAYYYMGTSKASMEDLKQEILNDMMERLQLEVQNPDVPFNTEALRLIIGKDENGEYIFLDPSFSLFSQLYTNYASYYQGTLIDEITFSPNRLQLHEELEFLQNYNSNNRKKMEHAKELAAILEMLIRSIEWEMD